MHMVIRAVVPAESGNEAMGKASSVFDNLVEFDVFDYYTTFDETNPTMSGRARYGELPTVRQIESDEGRKLVEDGWFFQQEEKTENIIRIRELMDKYSLDELVDTNPEMFQYYCYLVGQYKGSSIFLYNEWTEAISTITQYEDIWEKEEQMWVVPADVHY